MNRKNLIVVAFLVVVAIVLVWGGIYFSIGQNDAKMQGKLVFAQTFNQGEKIDHIVITTSDDVIDLRQEKSFWYVVNKGNYFADFSIVHQFLSAINQSVYIVKLPYSKKTAEENYLLNPLKTKNDSGMLIQTFIGENMLDEIIIGLPDKDETYFFARKPDAKDIWLIDGDFNLPIMAKYWLLRPVFSMPANQVESITIGESYAQREDKSSYFKNNLEQNINVEALLNVLNGIVAVDAKKKQDFEDEGFDKLQSKVIDVITVYGLEAVCNLYYDDKNVWLNINLTTTPLPMSAVNDYIRDNRFLYDGWYFEISPEQGHVLRDFRLM